MSSGSQSHPGVPTWARGAADYVLGDKGGGGFLGAARAGEKNLPAGDIFAMIAQLLNPAMAGGAMQRDIGAGLTQDAITGTQEIAGQSAAAAGQVGDLNSLVPQMLGAANDFAGNINQAESGAFLPAIGAANQTMQNVMNPTYYNPLFQNAAANITPEINAAFSSKGLGSSGASNAALDTAYSGLADDFAKRQVQEQQQSQSVLGQLGTQFAQTGIAGAQLPGTIYDQFMSGASSGQDALGKASANQMAPLGALQAGSANFWDSINKSMSTAGNAYGIGAQPMQNLLGGVTGTMGGISIPQSGWIGKIFGK